MKKTLFLLLAFMTVCGLCSVKAQFEIPKVPAELQETVDGYIQTLLQDPTDETVMKSIDKNKLLKKDKAALIAVGYKFLENRLFGNAIGLAKKVYDMDATFVPAVYLEGDAYFAMKNNNAYGLAAQKYEEAKTIDANSLDPYLKLVGVYRYINPDYAIELMNEIKEKKGDDPKVNQVLGTLYFQLSDTVNARAYYNKYFETYPDGQGDITVQREYVIILFMAKDYKGALNMSKKFQATNPNDPVLNRIEFLSKYELQSAFVNNVENQFAPGFDQKKDSMAADTKASYDKFYGSYPDSVYQELDYRYKAQYLAGLDDHKGAIAAYKKSVEIDPDNYSTQFNLSKEYEKVKDYDNAISSYRKYMKLAEKTEDINEEFKLARVYYNAARATKEDSLLRVKYIKGGDSIYAHVDSEMLKESDPSYLAVFWRSRINQLYDSKHPNAIAAKYMKEATERLKNPKFAGEDYNAHRAQAYSYIAWYELDKDNDAAKANAQEALKYEEDNALAGNVKKYLEILGKW
jgi:tetratricopeptide (TPR) repeat protein